MNRKISLALISVSDKTGIVEFAQALHQRGVRIISTGGTSEVLRKADVPVVDVATYTASPEILGGRVKTLHPKIHGGILGQSDDPQDAKEMEVNGISPIDMVVVNLYPFEGTVARPDCKFEEAIEEIDIGGPALVRAAGKNHEYVTVVSDPLDYGAVVAEMDANDGAITDKTRFNFAKKAFGMTVAYDCAIINWLTKFGDDKKPQNFPMHLGFTFDKLQPLRYGENPHQRAAFYRERAPVPEPSVVNARQVQGKDLSYNNIMDADAAIEIVGEFEGAEYAVVIVKHTNPCGVATSGTTLADAYTKALACDPWSAFGGIIGANHIIDEDTARNISESFFELIAAPGFTPSALEVFSKKKNLRLVEVEGLGKPFIPTGFSFRKVVGGLLLQERDVIHEDIDRARIVTKRRPSAEELAALKFAWRVCKHVKSNAIVFATADHTLGIGAGQTSRLDAVNVAGMKIQKDAPGRLGTWAPEPGAQGPRCTGAVVIASDAFFPFRDGIDAAAGAGATAVIQPGGSIRDDEVIAAADEHDMAMVFTGLRHFRH